MLLHKRNNMELNYLFNNRFPSPFTKYLNCFTKSISAELEFYLNEYTFHTIIKKDELVEAPPLVDSCLFLIQAGILRGYQYDWNGAEITTLIASEGDIITCISDFDLLVKSNATKIKAVEYTQMCGLNYNVLHSQFGNSKDLRIVRNILQARAEHENEKRNFVTRIQNINDRLKYYYKNEKHLLSRVPNEYLASYLSIPVADFVKMNSLQNKKVG
jgi:hypothetical protein